MNQFYGPAEIRPLYDQIIPAYQAAFAGEPWYEVSKCPDVLQRCTGGLSQVAVGDACELCTLVPNRPAYEGDELASRFDELANTRPTAWYVEEGDGGVALAAVAWRAAVSDIAKEKYSDVPAMTGWLDRTLGGVAVTWLDEVFADKSRRQSGNLRNFGLMCDGFMERLDTDLLAFRTVNERMVAAALRDGGGRSTVFCRNGAVPDRRDFVAVERSVS